MKIIFSIRELDHILPAIEITTWLHTAVINPKTYEKEIKSQQFVTTIAMGRSTEISWEKLLTLKFSEHVTEVLTYLVKGSLYEHQVVMPELGNFGTMYNRVVEHKLSDEVWTTGHPLSETDRQLYLTYPKKTPLLDWLYMTSTKIPKDTFMFFDVGQNDFKEEYAKYADLWKPEPKTMDDVLLEKQKELDEARKDLDFWKTEWDRRTGELVLALKEVKSKDQAIMDLEDLKLHHLDLLKIKESRIEELETQLNDDLLVRQIDSLQEENEELNTRLQRQANTIMEYIQRIKKIQEVVQE